MAASTSPAVAVAAAAKSPVQAPQSPPATKPTAAERPVNMDIAPVATTTQATPEKNKNTKTEKDKGKESSKGKGKGKEKGKEEAKTTEKAEPEAEKLTEKAPEPVSETKETEKEKEKEKDKPKNKAKKRDAEKEKEKEPEKVDQNPTEMEHSSTEPAAKPVASGAPKKTSTGLPILREEVLKDGGIIKQVVQEGADPSTPPLGAEVTGLDQSVSHSDLCFEFPRRPSPFDLLTHVLTSPNSSLHRTIGKWSCVRFQPGS